MLSATVGPAGGRLTSGAGPRPSGVMRTTRPELSGIQLKPAPAAALTRASDSLRAVPAATSAVHSSRPLGASIRKATVFPSGDQLGDMKRAPAGNGTARDAPPATGWKLRPVSQLTRLLAGPLLRGLIR